MGIVFEPTKDDMGIVLGIVGADVSLLLQPEMKNKKMAE
jgi:hypothetical protein